MTNLHIGIDARLIATRDGGIAEYTRRLIEALQFLDTTDPFTIFEGRHAARRAQPHLGNFSYRRAVTPCHHRIERLAFGIETAPHRLDVLHSPDFIPSLFGARRHVITVHDLTFLHYPQFQTADSARYYSGQIAAAVGKAAHILADSSATKRDLIDMLAVPEAKITVHRLGVDPAFRPLPAETVDPVLRRYGLTRGYVLHVGTYEPRKNLEGLFTAYARLRERHADLPPLVVAGRRGWLYESIFQKAADLHLEDRIKWLEDAPFSDLSALYNGASVLVMPSFYEGFGFPPLEAMACGIPTVVSDRSSLPEVVGAVGVLVNPDEPDSIADGLSRMLSETALRERSRIDGLARASGFTWRATAEIALQVYRSV